MAYQSLGLGSAADDGTGDNLRAGGTKINANFSEIYTLFGTGTALSSGISCSQDDITFVGSSYNAVWDKSASALAFADNAKATFGTGSDLQIWHDGTHSHFWDNGTGNLYIKTNGTSINFQDTAGKEMAVFTKDGATTLYHNNSAKIATSASGVSVTGSLVASSSVEVGAYIIFEGSTDNDNETTVQVTDPSADRTITIPDETGTLMTTGGTGNVTTAMLADDAVTTAKIATGAVTGDSIGANAVGISELATNAVTTVKITDANVTTAKIADSAVTSAKIADGTIVAADLATNAVTTAKIAADSITAAKIADDVINSEHYAADSIDEEHIANDAVGSAELKTLSTLLIKDSSGSTLKTCHCAGA